ncbi:hypothetical protein [Clavibacter capsici]|uniref:hypothetical protein n=1 Tax=Clavibacter capsici TaxID=1874630 RepID=UPI0006B21064|nr:hypothetical protein [Clavibacter capsici]ALD13133.1 hypothetical protein AES38_09555 [Clavibacter capsici]
MTTPGGPRETTYAERITLPPAAEAYLEQLGTDLLMERVGVHQLSPALSQLFWFAWQSGRDSLRPTIECLLSDRERYYLLAFNTPQQVRAIRQRRLDGHFQREAARFFGEATR